MKGLSLGDWSLIARCLKEEAGGDDLERFDALLRRFPNLKMELERLGREANTPRPVRSISFNSDQAWGRLALRLEHEGLV